MRVTVFAGPSLGAEECEALLPGAVVRAPAEQGDLLYAQMEDRPAVIVLIDGTFHQNLSVWHNEICHVLSAGVHVFGASSMGALRAVETEAFGTVGVGTVFEWYRHGVIEDDDEVALLHGPPESGFRPMSLPMVNIRASLAAAVSGGRMDAANAAEVALAAKSLFYADRNLIQILATGREAGLDGAALTAAEAALTIGYVDIKAVDARAVLQRVARLRAGDEPRPAVVAFDFQRSSVFEALYHLDRATCVDGAPVRLEEIASYAALHHPGFQQIRTAALNRELAVFLGLLLGVRVTPEEIAAEGAAFRMSRRLEADDVFHAWLQVNAWSEADLGEYLAQEAVCRRLRQWIAFARGFDRGVRATLDQLRADGEFERLAAETRDQDALAASFAGRPEYTSLADTHPSILAAQHGAATGVAIAGDVREWVNERGLESVEALVEALHGAAVARDVRERIAQHARMLQASAATSDPKHPQRAGS